MKKGSIILNIGLGVQERLNILWLIFFEAVTNLIKKIK